jgi:hypothetical protein
MSSLVFVNLMQMSFASFKTNIHQKYTNCTGTRRSDKKRRIFSGADFQDFGGS